MTKEEYKEKRKFIKTILKDTKENYTKSIKLLKIKSIISYNDKLYIIDNYKVKYNDIVVILYPLIHNEIHDVEVICSFDPKEYIFRQIQENCKDVTNRYVKYSFIPGSYKLI